ncbi:hypothetical protein AGABI2DRAFT_179406 [Agaricus bisporus var. bisporus H97]|uniref:hypothetical protein n=1 Tax=Agaricus bisporus var. bisporus (strain H97 / ATCC MYA-4626 / FGSC 10389) TaxID=936046 RepID=UPI00029F73B5|nr:hypothetical protein AGABI2DRAFT_179406 [Agaricus bisporus var. bisporus H97]EKV45962.1 hypothetical protein AGABI2DRAFT_179406 [Agaricus bisporus var. bisporus H97]
MFLKSLCLLLLFLTSFAASHPKQRFRWKDIKYVYLFGDSYSFVDGTYGFGTYRSETFEINLGKNYMGWATKLDFTPEQLLSNAILPNKTSSGGANWIEHLTGCYEGLPSHCHRQLWNFAHGGADISASILPRRLITTVQIGDQVQQWLDYAADILPRPHGKTLTVWWITDVDAFIDADLEAYFGLVETTARNKLHAHLFLNVPPIDLSPFGKTFTTGPESLRKTIHKFNKKFAARAAKYATDNPDQVVLTFDAASVFEDVLSHPAKFGFKDTTHFCEFCAAPDREGLFWNNDEHPSEPVHRILAEAVEEYLRRADL